MNIGQPILKRMLLKAAELIKAECPRLSEIDSRFGDGDHGVTMNKISLLIEARTAAWGDESIHDFLEALSVGIMGIGGGSAGPLYGTLVEGLAEPLGSESEIDAGLLKAMLAASRDAMFDISTARVGDKTMMDALIPAVEAAQEAPDEIGAVLTAAAGAAREGARASEQFVSKYGRAKSYKEQTIGTPDAGAVSTSLLIIGLSEGWG